MQLALSLEINESSKNLQLASEIQRLETSRQLSFAHKIEQKFHLGKKKLIKNFSQWSMGPTFHTRENKDRYLKFVENKVAGKNIYTLAIEKAQICRCSTYKCTCSVGSADVLIKRHFNKVSIKSF